MNPANWLSTKRTNREKGIVCADYHLSILSSIAITGIRTGDIAQKSFDKVRKKKKMNQAFLSKNENFFVPPPLKYKKIFK